MWGPVWLPPAQDESPIAMPASKKKFGPPTSFCVQSLRDHFRDVASKVRLDFVPDLGGHIGPVLAIWLRHNDVFDPGAIGRKHFFLDATNRQHAAAQAAFAGPRHAAPHA